MKRCEESASFVVIDDPDAPNPFCKEHGPEKKLKQMGVLYRKARGGEVCGQNVNDEKSSDKSAKTWSKDESKGYQALQGGYSGPSQKPQKKTVEGFRIRPKKKK